MSSYLEARVYLNLYIYSSTPTINFRKERRGERRGRERRGGEGRGREKRKREKVGKKGDTTGAGEDDFGQNIGN